MFKERIQLTNVEGFTAFHLVAGGIHHLGMIHIQQVGAAGVAMFLIKWILLIEAKRTNNNEVRPLWLLTVTHDHLDNCYVNGLNVRGQCVPYLNCQSAVENWHFREKKPYNCYNISGESYVCCPEAPVDTARFSIPWQWDMQTPNNNVVHPLTPSSGRHKRQQSKSKEGKYNKYHSNLRTRTVSYDHLGNCYVDGLNIRGQCVHYLQCQSALKKRKMDRKKIYSCNNIPNDNFVCCPVPPEITRQQWSMPAPNIFFNGAKFPSNSYQEVQRISEKVCFSVYNEQLSYRPHRWKRITNFIAKPPTPTPESRESSLLIQEDSIKKEHMHSTFAVDGISAYSNEFPYMCALGWRAISSKSHDITYNCGCVLIAPKHALTAAHCATLGGDSPYLVRMGGVDLDERHAEIIRIKRIVRHPEYNPKLAYNDIAIVKLNKRSRATPTCLWPYVGLPQKVLTAIGYGHTQFAGPPSNSLLKVYLNVMSNEMCRTFYKPGDKLSHGIGLGQICAGDPQGKMDTCQGDSGGPILMKVAKYNNMVPYIVGLTSYGEGCATGIPSVYTRISYYIDWIESQVWK